MKIIVYKTFIRTNEEDAHMPEQNAQLICAKECIIYLF